MKAHLPIIFMFFDPSWPIPIFPPWFINSREPANRWPGLPRPSGCQKACCLSRRPALCAQKHWGTQAAAELSRQNPRCFGSEVDECDFIEGSLEVKLPTIWTDEKQRWEDKSKQREEKKKYDQRRESLRRKKIQVREKVGKSRNTVFFQWFVAPEGRKVSSLKRRVRSQLARWEMKKLHDVVARSTFPSQNVQNTSAPEHFWKLRYRKNARRCGAKHISK